MGHPLVFALLAYLLGAAIGEWRGALSARNAVLLLGVLIGFGGFSEVLQHFTGRDASITDFVADVLGSWIGLALFYLRAGRNAIVWKRRLLWTSLTTATVLAVSPFAWTLSAYVYRHAQRPVIWRAGSDLLDKFAHRQQGKYPGLELTELPPDWRRFRELLITVRNNGPTDATFFVLAYDIQHSHRYEDRYNGEFVIAAATTQIYRISLQKIIDAPATRQMDVSKMSRLVVFETGESGVHDIDVLEIALAD